MNYLVNYKIIEGEFFFEEFLPKVELISVDNKVWANMPVGVISPLADTRELYLTPQGELVDTSFARTLEAQIKQNTKLFSFSLDENNQLIEDEAGSLVVRLPLDTDVTTLEYMNGEIFMVSQE